MVIGKSRCETIGECAVRVMDFLATADPGRAIILAAGLVLLTWLLWRLLTALVWQFRNWREKVHGLKAVEREVGFNLQTWLGLFSEEQRQATLTRISKAREAKEKDFSVFPTPAATGLMVDIARPGNGTGFTRQLADYYCNAGYLSKAVAGVRSDDFRRMSGDDQANYVNRVFDAGKSAATAATKVKRDIGQYLEMVDFAKVFAIYAVIVLAILWWLRG